MLLRLGVLSFHPSKRPLHFAEDPNGIGDQIRIAIAFMSRDQLTLTLNPEALAENLLFPDLDCLIGRERNVGHAIETRTQSKGSRPMTKSRLDRRLHQPYDVKRTAPRFVVDQELLGPY